jgi:hypothetical protein
MMGTKKEIGKRVACTIMILSRDYPWATSQDQKGDNCMKKFVREHM